MADAILAAGPEEGQAPTLSEAALRALADRVYELMRDDIVAQRERRGLGAARWR